MTKAEIQQVIGEATGEWASIIAMNHVGGGCINQAEMIKLDDGRKFFVKSNSDCPDDLFLREAEGLERVILEQQRSLLLTQVAGDG